MCDEVFIHENCHRQRGFSLRNKDTKCTVVYDVQFHLFPIEDTLST